MPNPPETAKDDLIRQIDLLTQSYTLEKQNTALTARHETAEGVASIRRSRGANALRQTPSLPGSENHG